MQPGGGSSQALALGWIGSEDRDGIGGRRALLIACLVFISFPAARIC